MKTKIFLIGFMSLILSSPIIAQEEQAGEVEQVFVDSNLIEKKWELIEINGKEVVADENMKNKAFIFLSSEGRINGSGGCNSFLGSYEIKNPNRLQISQLASTMMMCMNMEVEQLLIRSLETADNYSLSEDKQTLSLNRARMAPLARFRLIPNE